MNTYGMPCRVVVQPVAVTGDEYLREDYEVGSLAPASRITLVRLLDSLLSVKEGGCCLYSPTRSVDTLGSMSLSPI